MNYFSKMKGITKSPPAVSVSEVIWSWIGAFLGIIPMAYLDDRLFATTDMVMIIGSFGASAVLVYGAIRSPLAQPRNVLGGHIISAVIGVLCYKHFHNHLWFASPLAVASAITAMHATKTLHPPGGATALIAVTGSLKIHALGFFYAIVPVGLGAMIMVIIALIVNNMSIHRRYPEYWF